MPTILAVEHLLRLSLDTDIDTKSLRVAYGMAPEVARLLAEGEDREHAFISLARACELTGIGSHHTVEAAAERQSSQVGLVVQVSKGRKGRFFIRDRETADGRGYAGRWVLGEARVEPLPLLDAEGGQADDSWVRGVAELVDPTCDHMRSDLLWRATLVLLATHGLARARTSAAELQGLLGCSRASAYRAMAQLRDEGWVGPDGTLYLADFVNVEHFRKRPQTARERVRRWIRKVVDAQVAYARAFFDAELAWAQEHLSPLEVDPAWLIAQPLTARAAIQP